MWQTAKLEGLSHVSSLEEKFQTSDMVLSELAFALLAFGLALFQYLLNMSHFIHLAFGMGICIQFCGMLEECNMVLVLQGLTEGFYSESFDFGLLNSVTTIKDSGDF